MTLRERLQRGVAAGVGLTFATPQLVELCARVGFHWALIDCEHGVFSPEALENACIAADAAGLSLMVRPPNDRPETILAALDRGAAGVQVPHVATAAQAAAVVRAVKYAPIGERGLGTSVRTAGYGVDLDVIAYVERANRETIVCVQIEDREGLANVAEIAAVPGVDVVFIGPMDLSQALGHPGDLTRPDFRRAVERAFETAIGAGVLTGTSGSASWVRYGIGHGARYVYTGLGGVMLPGARDFIALAQPRA
ncbi:MAG TPA: aldolase/citrate lyase family protein [Candidatus Elarobacter sp.]